MDRLGRASSVHSRSGCSQPWDCCGCAIVYDKALTVSSAPTSPAIKINRRIKQTRTCLGRDLGLQNYRNSFKIEMLFTADCMLCVRVRLRFIWEWVRWRKSRSFLTKKMAGTEVRWECVWWSGSELWRTQKDKLKKEKGEKKRECGRYDNIHGRHKIHKRVTNWEKGRRVKKAREREDGGQMKKRNSDKINKTNTSMRKADRESVHLPGFFRVVLCSSLQSACPSVSASLFWVRIVYSCPDNISKTHLWTHATALSHLSTHGDCLPPPCHHTSTRLLL